MHRTLVLVIPVVPYIAFYRHCFTYKKIMHGSFHGYQLITSEVFDITEKKHFWRGFQGASNVKFMLM